MNDQKPADPDWPVFTFSYGGSWYEAIGEANGAAVPAERLSGILLWDFAGADQWDRALFMQERASTSALFSAIQSVVWLAGLSFFHGDWL